MIVVVDIFRSDRDIRIDRDCRNILWRNPFQGIWEIVKIIVGALLSLICITGFATIVFVLHTLVSKEGTQTYHTTGTLKGHSETTRSDLEKSNVACVDETSVTEQNLDLLEKGPVDKSNR